MVGMIRDHTQNSLCRSSVEWPVFVNQGDSLLRLQSICLPVLFPCRAALNFRLQLLTHVVSFFLQAAHNAQSPAWQVRGSDRCDLGVRLRVDEKYGKKGAIVSANY